MVSLKAITAADGVPVGDRKTSPRTSSIVQIIFYVWSNILRTQK